MERNILQIFTGESGIYPLLLFFVLALLCYIRRVKGKDRSLHQLIIVFSLAIAVLLLNSVCWLMIGGADCGLESLGEIYLLTCSPFIGNLFIVPILRGGACKAPLQFFKWSLWGILGISLLFSMLSWTGVSLAFLKPAGYFLIFCTHSAMVFCMVVYRKIVRETMLLINNLSFILVLMADFMSYILLSLAFMAKSGWLASIFVSILSILVVALQFLWFFKWESMVAAPEVKTFSIVENRPVEILSERDLEYGGYGIKARLYQLFDEEKPYLNPDLTIGEVSDMLYVNKSYLSKTLNNNLNVNFNEFVNNYRVNEARRIFMEDHNITLEEMRVKSGFRHASSFNNAFKICTGHTPGEWCRSIKREDVCNGSVEENF